jgi:hypothetical protein
VRKIRELSRQGVQGGGSGLRAVESKVGRIGQLACWEHYNRLARFAMMADDEAVDQRIYRHPALWSVSQIRIF